jgi:serine/threonine-protein kinase
VVTGWLVFAGSAQPSRDRKMLVVLPFDNLGALEDEYFSDGLTDAINARLGVIHGLGVISRQSAVQYKSSDKSAGEIGEELGVEYILEGTVQRERPGDPGSRVRVIPQLIRVSDDTHVWAETYDDEMAEIFRVQSDIAERIALALDITLLEPDRRLVRRRSTDNQQAYEYYLRGRAHELNGELRAAVSMYETAVEQDPNFAEAYAALGAAIWRLGFSGQDVSGLPNARAALDKAVQLGPDLVETHLALGDRYYMSRWYDSATVHLEFVRARQPSNSEAIARIGWMQRRQGKWEEHVETIETALALDPRNHRLAGGLGHTFLLMRQYSEAERYLNRAIAMAPESSAYHGWLVLVYLSWDGSPERARSALQEAVSRVGGAVLGDGPLIRVFADDFGADLDRFGPADEASTGDDLLAKARWHGRRNQSELARAYYDSARARTAAAYTRVVDSLEAREGRRACFTRVPGRALAGLGRTEEAVIYAKKHTQLCTTSGDAISGPLRVMDLAEIYVMAGMYDDAIEQLEYTLSIPSPINAGLLIVDPIWDPLRDHPRFQELLESDTQ